MSNEVVQWSKKVYYITKDDIVLNFVNKVKPLYIYPIKSGCILTAIKMSSDSFTEEVPYDRIVVARNSYDYYNNLYETTIEIIKEGGIPNAKLQMPFEGLLIITQLHPTPLQDAWRPLRDYCLLITQLHPSPLQDAWRLQRDYYLLRSNLVTDRMLGPR
jgi:hypothetical protein